MRRDFLGKIRLRVGSLFKTVKIGVGVKTKYCHNIFKLRLRPYPILITRSVFTRMKLNLDTPVGLKRVFQTPA